MKLAYTEIFRQYQSLFEKTLESFISDNGCSINDFYNQLKKEANENPNGEEAILGRLILAASDFGVFMLMMSEARKKQIVTMIEKPINKEEKPTNEDDKRPSEDEKMYIEEEAVTSREQS